MGDLSPHFWLREMTATRHVAFLQQQRNPPISVLLNLRRLCLDVLEPLRALVGPLRVTSGWRCMDLNVAVGGSPTSKHLAGSAADVVPMLMSVREAYDILVKSDIPYDEAIYEYGSWIHVAAPRHGSRPSRETLMCFSPGKYEAWNPNDIRATLSMEANV